MDRAAVVAPSSVRRTGRRVRTTSRLPQSRRHILSLCLDRLGRRGCLKDGQCRLKEMDSRSNIDRIDTWGPAPAPPPAPDFTLHAPSSHRGQPGHPQRPSSRPRHHSHHQGHPKDPRTILHCRTCWGCALLLVPERGSPVLLGGRAGAQDEPSAGRNPRRLRAPPVGHHIRTVVGCGAVTRFGRWGRPRSIKSGPPPPPTATGNECVCERPSSATPAPPLSPPVRAVIRGRRVAVRSR